MAIKQHIDNGGSVIDCPVNDGHYCIYCAQEANQREIDTAYARGLVECEARGLERAAEMVKQQAANALANPNKPIAGVLSDMLLDEAAKVRADNPQEET